MFYTTRLSNRKAQSRRRSDPANTIKTAALKPIIASVRFPFENADWCAALLLSEAFRAFMFSP
jgi:hypothetical protein